MSDRDRVTRAAVAALWIVGCQGQTVTDVPGPTVTSQEQAVYSNLRFCTKCHGGLDNDTGAPPFDLAGNSATTQRSVGAHSAHVQVGPMARALGCVECHPQTEDVCSALHLDGQLNLQFGATASSHGVTPTYDAPNCTNWCHGATLAGGTNTQPSWTAVGQGEAACGTCHGIPPTMPSPQHPIVPQGTKCKACHPETMTVDALNRDVLIPGGGKHVNGTVEVQGHGAGWYDPASPTGGQHGANLWNGWGTLSMSDYYVSCTECHGNGAGEFNVIGGWSGVSCGQCHPAFFITQQPVGMLCGGKTTVPCTSCIFCH